MTAPYTRILQGMPAMTPFVGPETLERRRGRPFRLRLGANESAFGMSPNARTAIEGELARASWYCDPEHWALREKLAARLGTTASNIVIGEGIDGILGTIVRAFVEPGDTIVTSAGAYPTFNYHVLGYGGRLLFVPYRADFHNDVEALVEQARTSSARLLYLANPDNPTGTFLDADAVKHLLAEMPADCLLVLDEAYAEFAPEAEIMPIRAEDPRLIRLRTFSKAHGMAGLRIGYGIAAQSMIETFNRIRLHFGVGRLSQIAAAASLDDDAFAAGVVQEVALGRAEYRALAERHDLPAVSSLTNFVALDLGSAAAADRLMALLDEQDVFVRKPGMAPLDRLVRVTVGTPEERKQFAGIFADAIRLLRG